MLIILETGNAELLFHCLRGSILRPSRDFMYNFNRYNVNLPFRVIPKATADRIVIMAHAGNWKHRHADHT